MAEEKEIRVRSFRIDDQTAEKFKVIASQLGGNQQQTMAKLIEAYELQGSLTALPEYKADIEQFEGLTSRLAQMYISMLQANQDITANVRAQFAAQLQAADDHINILTIQLKAAQAAEKMAEEIASKQQADLDELKERTAKLERDTTARLQDADRTVKATQQSVDLMQSEIERLKKELERAKTDQTELEKLKADNADLRRQLEQADLEKEKAVFAERKKAQQEIDKYQQQIFSLMAKK